MNCSLLNECGRQLGKPQRPQKIKIKKKEELHKKKKEDGALRLVQQAGWALQGELFSNDRLWGTCSVKSETTTYQKFMSTNVQTKKNQTKWLWFPCHFTFMKTYFFFNDISSTPLTKWLVSTSFKISSKIEIQSMVFTYSFLQSKH